MKKDFGPIATPDKIPNSLDLTEYPAIPGNAAIRAISESNKDLVARLNVQLRRNGELESHCENLKKRIEALIAQNEDLSNSSLKNRELAKMHQEELEGTQRLLAISEIELGRLSLQYRETRAALEQQKYDIALQLKRLKKYRKNIHQKVRPYINRVLQENIQLMTMLKSEQSKNFLSKDQIDQLQERLGREKHLHKSKVQEAGYLQEEIISTYELELKQYKNLLDQKEIEQTSLLQRQKYLEEIRDKYVVTENRAIAAERMRYETEKRYDSKISELRQHLLETKDQYKLDKKDFEVHKNLVEKLTKENEELMTRLYSTGTQVASLQGKTQVEFITNQELKARSKSLDKENLELKKKLASMQEENSQLREELDLVQNPPKVPEQMPDMYFIEESSFVIPENTSKTNESFHAKLPNLDFKEVSEIDQLIQEIESGYPSKKQKSLE